MSPDRTDAPVTEDYATVYVAFELSKAKWRLGVVVPGSQKVSGYTIAGGDLTALTARLADARGKAERSGRPVRILSCYEAGFDGHWLHRWLTAQGVISHEIDAASIEVNRRARRAKTDRIDLDKLMRTFLAYLRGEPRACSVVRVPWKMRTASGGRASGIACCRNAPRTPIASRACCTRRASARWCR